jgi:hypothetical protein
LKKKKVLNLKKIELDKRKNFFISKTAKFVEWKIYVNLPDLLRRKYEYLMRKYEFIFFFGMFLWRLKNKFFIFSKFKSVKNSYLKKFVFKKIFKFFSLKIFKFFKIKNLKKY